MTFFSRAKKTVKRGTRAVTKAAGKRYGVSYGRKGLKMSKSSVSRIAKDVMMIKSRLNVEKKFKDGSLTTGSVAQVDGSFNSGYYTSTLTPVISLGVTENDRVGGSIKLTGLHVQLQFQGQADCYSRRRLKICLISSTDPSVTNAIDDMWDPNPLTGLRDYHSNRNYSNNPRAHKLLRTLYCQTPQKQINGGDTDYAVGLDKKFGLKMNQITRFEASGNTPKDMHYFLVIFCNDGNKNFSTASSNSGILTTGVNTGLNVQEYFRWWYVDN